MWRIITPCLLIEGGHSVNNLRWITSMMNMGNKRSFFGLRKRRNRGMGTMLFTLLGLGASIGAFFGLRGQNNNMEQPMQKGFKNPNPNNTNQFPFKNAAATAEFAKEFTPENEKDNNN